jgi:hypothetical protein
MRPMAPSRSAQVSSPQRLQLGAPGFGEVTIGLTPEEARHIAVFIIMAHEFGHILQYKKGFTPDGPWQMEPHADFMAGWFLSQIDEQYGSVLVAATILFRLGDTEFTDTDHHGEPELRAAMLQSGYEFKTLNVEDAFLKGRSLANLREPPKLGAR